MEELRTKATGFIQASRDVDSMIEDKKRNLTYKRIIDKNGKAPDVIVLEFDEYQITPS